MAEPRGNKPLDSELQHLGTTWDLAERRWKAGQTYLMTLSVSELCESDITVVTKWEVLFSAALCQGPSLTWEDF